MNTLFEREEREEKQELQDSEVTLNTGTLLAIFFGLVVVCGVFFGFGYSMGRRSSDAKAAAAAAQAVVPPAADSTAASTSRPKPSALEVMPPPAESAATTGDESDPRTVVVDQPLPPAPPEAKPKAVPVKAPVAKVAAAPAPSRQTNTTVIAKPVTKQVAVKPVAEPRPAPLPVKAAPIVTAAMVQIAAISRPEDAEALVAALKRRGYAVVVRNEPQDKLLHIQVGPFANHVDAVAARQKLLSDGYNAIIK